VKVLVTGSCGLIGSEAVLHYHQRRASKIVGIDNNMRARFFGAGGDTLWMKEKLKKECRNYHHLCIDIRDRLRISRIISELKPDIIIHTAAQPSHDFAAQVPFLDFEVNAMGTLNLLEATRQSSPDSTFIFMSTNKVYGDSPNKIRLRELKKRWDFADSQYSQGIPETLSIDQSKHSLFGCSKLSADILVQEYVENISE